jgi:chromosome segregation ATPase
LRQQLEESQKERKTLEKEIIDLTASQQRARQETEAVSLQLRQARDLIQRRNAEMEELKAEYRKLDTPSGAEHTNAMIADLALSNQELTEAAKACEGRIHALTLETANLKSQLKQARTSSGSHSAITNSTMSLDPFDNKLDQVSEASLKGGVEGINDSLDNLVLLLLDKAEELAQQSAHGIQPLATQTHHDSETTELLKTLATYGQDEDKRGFLLDVLLHQAVIKQLTALFFSGEVVARVLDSKGFQDMYLMELAKRGECFSIIVSPPC